MNQRGMMVIALTLAVASTILTAPTVFAHARYKSSTPGTGEVLATSPAHVEITFSEEIQKISGTYGIEVVRDRGASVTSGPAVVDDSDRTRMSVPIESNLDPGRYVVNWKNTSDDDGDAINGAFAFYVNTQPNTVDLANDAQLAQVGFEEVTATAAAAGTPGTGATASATAAPVVTKSVGTQGPSTSAVTPIPTTAASPSSSDGDSNTVLYVVIALVVAAVLVGGGIWQYTSRRRP